MISKVFGSAVHGVTAFTITTEVNIGTGTGLWIVGLPDSAVKESEHRVEAALKNLGYYIPRQKIIVNMAPADLRKEGSAYDLPIALGILSASGQIIADTLDQYVIMGELSLDGELRPIKGALPIAIEARRQGFKGFILPKQNEREAAIVNNLEVLGVSHLQEAIDHFENRHMLTPISVDTREIFFHNMNNYEADFAHVQGQENIKRALEIAASAGLPYVAMVTKSFIR